MQTTTAAPLAPELAQEALHILTAARDHSQGSIVRDLENLIPQLQSAQAAGAEELEGIPERYRIAFTESSMPDGSISWATVRAHLTAHHAHLLATLPVPIKGASMALRSAMLDRGLVFSYLPKDAKKEPLNRAAVTGYGLAKALGLDLYGFAAEVWGWLDGSNPAFLVPLLPQVEAA